MPDRQRVAVTVFAEVNDAINQRDAGNVVAYLIREVLPPGQQHEVAVSAGTWNVVIHDVMETGIAASEGYVWTAPTSKAYTQYSWQREDRS